MIAQGNALGSRPPKNFQALKGRNKSRLCIRQLLRYPFLLNIYRDYAAGSLFESQFSEVLNVLENYLVRRFICGVPTYGLNKMFPTLTLEVLAEVDEAGFEKLWRNFRDSWEMNRRVFGLREN